jgi:CIC family chloride channel protein
LFGLICGLLSASFLNCIDFLTRKIRLNYWKKITIAALFTAFLSWLSPESIGLGYQLLDMLLYEQQLPSLLMLWFLIRFIGSIAVISLAIPGGALGPSLILGALTGAVFSQLLSIESGQLFVVVGMGAFLGAVLRVPLAGMLFVLEVTNEITLVAPCIIASYAAFYLHNRLSTHNNLIELLLVRQKIILRDSPSLRKKRLTSPL